MLVSALRTSSRTFCLALYLNPLVDFFAVNRYSFRGGDAEYYLLPANAQHLNADVVVYADGFAYSSGKYQHADAPWFVVPERRAGAIRGVNRSALALRRGAPGAFRRNAVLWGAGRGGPFRCRWTCGGQSVRRVASKVG